jgi:hypothetical protein
VISKSQLSITPASSYNYTDLPMCFYWETERPELKEVYNVHIGNLRISRVFFLNGVWSFSQAHRSTFKSFDNCLKGIVRMINGKTGDNPWNYSWRHDRNDPNIKRGIL